MRRLVLICAFAAALAAPASGLASHGSFGDGTLVVRNGDAPRGVPVVSITINGAVIGHVGHGKIVIADWTPNNRERPEVTGWESHKNGPTDTAETWSGLDMSFRAVDGKYTVLVYGSDVDLVAVGRGTVTLAGNPDLPLTDGSYSLNGDPWRSLPGTPTRLLTIGSLPAGG